MKLLMLLLASLFGIRSCSQSNPEGITFAVDDVKVAETPLPANDFRIIAQNKLERPIFALPNGVDSTQIIPANMNAFAYTIHTAFDEHRPLILTPDDIWLAICQGFGNHLVANADKLEGKLLAKKRPEEIYVFIEDLAQNNSDGWEELVQGFNDSLAGYIKGPAMQMINQQFTTTTPVISTAYQITMMDAVKSFFKYTGGSGCGIPSITLKGTPEDWQQIYDNIDQFNAYGMEFWTSELKPVLNEFVLASKGEANVEFWQSIYKHEAFYGVSAISGWMLKFFPYLEGERNLKPGTFEGETPHETYFYRNPFIVGNKHLLSDISTYDLPKGYVNVPFTWKEIRPQHNDVVEHHLMLHAGFFGIQQEGIHVQPFISWCITNQERAAPEDIRWRSYHESDPSIAHKEIYWIPGVQEEVKVLPVFDPSENHSYDEGIKAFKQLLKSNGFDGKGSTTLKLVVAWDGSLIFEQVTGALKTKEVKLREFIALQKSMWKPAESEFKGWSPDHERALYPCNYSLFIQL